MKARANYHYDSEVSMDRHVIREFIESELLSRKSIDHFYDSTSLIESGIVDSLGIQSLVAFLEKEFSIEVSDLDLLPDNFESVNAIISYIKGKSA